MIFKHTSKERGLWRGWLRNGQAVEISTGNPEREFGGGVHTLRKDDGRGDRLLFLCVWRMTVILPLGVIDREYVRDDVPQWSIYASGKSGLTIHCGRRRWHWDWPWSLHTLAYEQQIIAGDEGSWVSFFDRDGRPYTETHHYSYRLMSGEVQHCTATVSKRRHVLTYRAFKGLGWPRWVRESIEVQFSREIGEGSGSWDGGCIICGWDILPGETMEDALRRMESVRKF